MATDQSTGASGCRFMLWWILVAIIVTAAILIPECK